MDDASTIFRPTDPASWDLNTDYHQSHSAVAGEVLADLADDDPRIVVLTADLKYTNRTADFEQRHPSRFFNTGICEQNMVSMSAGLAAAGKRPYVATFASFAGLLCIEQIRTDLAYPGMPVKILAHHAGISMGFYGTSHHTTEDIGVTRSIAGLTVMAPCDANSFEMMLRQTVDHPQPIYFRLGRGRDEPVYEKDDARHSAAGLSVLRTGSDLVVVANGVTVSASLKAADALAQQGIEATVLDAHTIRPFDVETLYEHARACGRIVVVEEHNVYGGLASVCADALVDAGLTVPLRRVGLDRDEYSLIGPPTRLYEHYGLDAKGIEKAILETLGSER